VDVPYFDSSGYSGSGSGSADEEGTHF